MDVGGGVVVGGWWHDDNEGGVGVEQGLVGIGYVASPGCLQSKNGN